jgi:hypothetical protein
MIKIIDKNDTTAPFPNKKQTRKKYNQKSRTKRKKKKRKTKKKREEKEDKIMNMR